MSPRPPFPPVQARPSKHRLFIGILLAVVLLGGLASFLMSGTRAPRKASARQEIVTITLPPPAPPPPPPPKVEPPPAKEEPPEKDEMVEQEPVPDDEPPPEAALPDLPPAEDLGGGNPNGTGPPAGIGGGTGTGGTIGRRNRGSKFGWYAAKVQTTIAQALRENPATRSAAMTLQVRVWPDANGRITRVQLVGTSGNPAVDQAIKDQILTGLQLPQAPPADMPVPIVLRITARKPGT